MPSIAVPFENSVTRVLRNCVEAESLKNAGSVNISSARYSNDLRWRIVYQGIAINLPLVKIAQNVAVSAVDGIPFEESEPLDPLSPRLDLRNELHVAGVTLENPSMYLGVLYIRYAHSAP